MLEWKNLGEIADVTNGERPNTPILEKGEYPYINAGRTNSGWLNVFNSIKGAVTTPSHGEGGIGSVLFQEKDFWCGALCYKIYTHNCVLGKYLFHYLKNNPSLLLDCKNVGGQPYINRKQLEKVPIEVPPIAEQTRIVGILDTFTASIENLKQQIAQRRKQYNWIIDHFYYSDKYEMIKAAEEGKVQVKTMDEIGTFIRGRRFVRTDIVQEGIPCIHYGDMYTYYGVWADKAPTFLTKEKATKLRFAQKGDVVIVAAGENDIDIGVGVAWLGEDEVVVHDACFIYKHDMDPKYISYFLRSMNYHLQIRMGVVDGKICSISAKELGRTLVPIPSLPEQQRIVSILDTFEASIANLEQQLVQREKQYEYYRNKLLTFE